MMLELIRSSFKTNFGQSVAGVERSEPPAIEDLGAHFVRPQAPESSFETAPSQPTESTTTRLSTQIVERAYSHPSTPPSPRQSKRFTRTLLNFWIDAALLVLFLMVLWTSAAIRFVFPTAALASGWELWGWSYQHWADFHFVVICLFALAVLVHVMLHWNWVCSVVMNQVLRGIKTKAKLDDGMRTLYGVGLLILLLGGMGLLLAIATLTVQLPG